jgi:two-component system cell cycle response regulator DivK
MFNLRVLVIEDTQENMDLICLLLERGGHQVYQAYDGVEGIRTAFEQQPDLILLDLALPKKDGWTVATQLKSDILTRSIPIIAITAYVTKDAEEKALQAGCDGFIPKPFTLSAFNEEIDRFRY